MNELTLTSELEAACLWLQMSRSKAPPDADVWHLRHHWGMVLPVLRQQLAAGGYRLSPVQVVKGQKKKVLWTARDALVLKWVAQRLTPLLPVHPRCEHVKGHDGGKVSVTRLHNALSGGEYRYVFRTDIRGYYGAINKSRVLCQLRQYVEDPVLTDLVAQYLHYTVEDGGIFHTPERGISRSCPLSPLIGAFHLYEVDAYFAEQKDIVYARYMDDFVILAKSRWSLRRHVKALNGFLAEYGFEKHPDKTFVGRVNKGFDWLGAWLDDTGVSGVGPRALANHREKVRRLYERLWFWPRARVQARVSQYRKRWTIWAAALLAVVANTSTAHAAWNPWTNGVTLRACTPARAIRFWDGPQVLGTGVTAPFLTSMGGMYMAQPWSGTAPPSASQIYVGVTGPEVGTPWTNCPNVGTVTGIVSSDGHAVLYIKDRSEVNTWSWTAGASNPKWATTVGGGGPVSIAGEANGASYQYRWPSFVRGGTNNNWMYWSSTYKHMVEVYILWDGTTPPTDTAYSLPAGTFAAVEYVATDGSDVGRSVSPPSNIVTQPPPQPTCSTVWLYPLVSATGGTVPLHNVDLPAACTSPGCSRHNIAGLASSSIALRCATPAGHDKSSTAVVKPRLTFSGQTTGDSGPYLLQTSQTGVFLWGQTGGGLNGCNYWGQSGVAETYHPVPFDGVTRWRGGWDDTSDATAWPSATMWQSPRIQINWGLCVDTSAGSGRSVQAGPFTATATYTIHLD